MRPPDTLWGGDLWFLLLRVVWAGLKDRQAVPVVTDKVVMRSLTVYGGSGGTAQSVDEAARILNEGEFPTAPLLGVVVGLDEVDRAMALLHREGDEDAVRAVLRHGH